MSNWSLGDVTLNPIHKIGLMRQHCCSSAASVVPAFLLLQEKETIFLKYFRNLIFVMFLHYLKPKVHKTCQNGATTTSCDQHYVLLYMSKYR